jgi:hypothetical protein
MMGHAFAYGKMTVVAPEGFVIDHVDVAFKGMHYGYDYKHNLTLNATNVTDNVFMFSTYPMQVTEFTVTAYDTNGTTCTKSVDLIELETYFAFKYDTVVPFGVTLEAEEPEQPGGGDEPVQPENPSNADGKTLETAYTFTTYTKVYDMGFPVMCLSGSEDNAVFEFESNNDSNYPTGQQKFNSGAWYPNWLKYEVNGTLIHSTYGPEQPSAINLEKSYTWLERGGSGYTVEYIMIVLDNGDTVWYKFNGSFAF